MDKQHAKRITTFLRERVTVLDDPRSIGEALKVDSVPPQPVEIGLAVLFAEEAGFAVVPRCTM